MAEFPTGTVTFLFTDLERSTPLWEQHPDAMGEALKRHDEILRGAVETHGGTAVKTTGDGLHAVFSTASSAVAAAVAAQTTLVVEAWPLPEVLRVRMGLHTGPAEIRDRDYYGPTVNRAARVTAAAHPGQILVSDATATLLEGWTLRHLGDHRLRGLAPMRLHQVVAPGLADDFPQLATAALGVILPTPPTRFVGREAEVDVVRRLVGAHRLVTLTGMGGSGKTRLAIEAGERLAARFPEGIRFVDLAAVTDETRVADAVVHALGLSDDPSSAEPLARLGAYLADRALLCVLDNCEHVLDACAGVADVVMSCPGPTRLLATSRAPLGVVGEQVYGVPSLDDPDAVSLFAERGAEARAGFIVEDANLDVVTQICRGLDGIPLAIELAAARVAHLSPTQLLDRLDDRLRLLTGERGRVQRQQTLAATLDWSHDLLDGREQVVLRRLAVFPAGFSLDAAEAVAEVDNVVQPLGSLVAKSLVQVVDDGDQLRYRLLETVRLYAESKLVAASEARTWRARHRDWVLSWLESIPLEERWFGDDDPLITDEANIRAALEWSSSEGNIDALARIAAGVDWSRGDIWQEGISWCEAATAMADVLSPDLQARLCLMLFQVRRITLGGATDWAQRNEWAQRAIDACHGEPSPLAAVALASRGLGAAVLATESRDESLAARAIDWAEAGVAMSENFAVPWRMYCRLLAGETYLTLNLSLLRGPDRTEEHFAAGMAAAPPAPPYVALHARLSCYLALYKAVAGDAQGAHALAREVQLDGALELWGLEDPLALALVVALASTNDVARARRELRAYDEAARRADWGLALESVALYGGILAALRGQWDEASMLLAAGERSVYRSPATALLYFAFRDAVRAALGPERSRRLRADGKAMPLADARKAALADVEGQRDPPGPPH
jgi:predicted ATPase/class 3 adenylate cyclase